jgi:hypothetical protein
MTFEDAENGLRVQQEFLDHLDKTERAEEGLYQSNAQKTHKPSLAVFYRR